MAASTGHQVMVRLLVEDEKNGNTYHLECLCGRFEHVLTRTDEATAERIAARHERLSD